MLGDHVIITLEFVSSPRVCLLVVCKCLHDSQSHCLGLTLLLWSAPSATTLPPTLSPSKHTPSQQAQDETEAASTKASTPAPTSALQITTAELAQAQAQAPAKPIAAAGASEPPAKKKKKKKKRDLL
eukprot:m.68145 g.68145  ORF g.68145 m.68145 type:complete len:127 (+) comp12187_c0_seq4:1118-1498(+)